MRSLSLVFFFLLAPLLFGQFPPDDVIATIEPLKAPESGTKSSVLATLRNRTTVPLQDVRVDFTLSNVKATLTAAPHPAWPQNQWSCTQVTPHHVSCRVDIAQGPDQFIPLVLTVDPVIEGRFGLTAQATWVRGDVVRRSVPYSVSLLLERELVVTSAADSGPGTLREAIETLNGTCTEDAVPCGVRFNIANATHTIVLQSPLPPIIAPDFSIDARPDYEIDGSLLLEGHGLDIRGEGPAIVRDLSIGGFPWNGVQITRRQSVEGHQSWLFANRIGLRPNLTPNPNRSRGVTISAPASHVSISSNVISANLRSGVFIEAATDVAVSQNVIGELSILHEHGNGASGVFAGPGSRRIVINDCVIVGNAHFGVAIARGAEGVVLQSTNRIIGNGILPIDHGLDGFSGYGREPLRAPTPRITSARYDAATNRTTIEGTLDVPDPSKEWIVTVFVPEAVWTDLPLVSTIVTNGVWSYSYDGHALFGTHYSAYANSSDSSHSTSEFAELVELR